MMYIAVIVGLVGLWMIGYGLWRFNFPKKHPIPKICNCCRHGLQLHGAMPFVRCYNSISPYKCPDRLDTCNLWEAPDA